MTSLPTRFPSLIALDLDGTALRPDGTFSPATRAAIADAENAGVPVAIITGRSERQALALARNSGLVDDAIRAHRPAFVSSALGGVTVDATSGDVVAARHIDPATARTILAATRSRGDDVTIVGDVDQIALRDSIAATSPFVDRVVDDLTPYAERATLVRITGTTAAADVAGATGDARARVGHSLGTPQLEIAPPGVDKGSALRDLLARTGADPATAIAIGDTDVDVPMFAVAGQSVAMGNAIDAIASTARFRTEDNTHDGVARAIEAALNAPRAHG